MKFETVLSTAGSPWGRGKAAYSKDLGRFWAPVERYGRLIPLLADVSQRIDGLVVQEHFEVQVRTGGPARLAHARNHLATAHGIADGDQIVDVVGIARDVAIAMV